MLYLLHSFRFLIQFKQRHYNLFLIGLLFCTFQTLAQNSGWGIKYFGVSIHPQGEGENAKLMPNKLDKEAYIVFNLGIGLSYETFIISDLISLKFNQGVYADCAARLGGFTHVGLRGKIFRKGKHYLSGGIGPTIVYRRNWQELEGYENPDRFRGDADDKWQYMFLWYGGEFEYRYAMNKQLDFAISLVPGYPDLISLSLGVTYNIVD